MFRATGRHARPSRALIPLLAGTLCLAACRLERQSASGGSAAPDSTASLFEDGDDGLALESGAGLGGAAASLAVPHRVISLKAVDRLLAACPAAPHCRDSTFLMLGGLTTVSAVIFDERAGDALLVGEAREGRPGLWLEDLAAALRNAWLAYVQQKGNRITYLHPGLSLEPSPSALKDLRRIAGEIARIDAAGGEGALERWKEACRRPYRVVVTGLPPDCRLTRTLLRADYALKGLANGSEALGLRGFPGMAELRRIRFQSEQAQGAPPAAPLPSLARYWFHPGSQEWESAEGLVVLKRCPIVLMTEEMFGRLRGGDTSAAPPADDLAEAFAYGFTRLYDQVAEAKPVFRELEGIFRLVAAAKLVRDRFPESEAGTAFPALFQGWRLPRAGTEAEVPGLPELQHFDHARSTPMGMEIDRYWLPSCGGISVAVEPGKAWVRRQRDPRLPAFRKEVLAARPSDTAWRWDVPGSPRDYWSGLRERLRMQELSQRFPELAFYRVRRAGEGGKVLELLDEDDQSLGSGTAQAVFEAAAARADARKLRSVFLELTGAAPGQAETFRAAAAAFAAARKAPWTLVPVVDRPGWLRVENPLLTPAADWEPGDPPREAVGAGRFKGWQRITFRFLVSASGKTVPAALHVMVKSPPTAERLQEEAAQAFRARVFIGYSPLTALFSVLGEFRESLPPGERGEVLIVEDEAGSLVLG